ncbi:MAG: phosphatase PAP2 family protein [Ginsengibacter sp.]
MTFLDIEHPMYIPEKLKTFDLSLFHKINGEWHTPFLDNFLPFLREFYLWLPLYFFLMLFIIINFKMAGWYWALFFIINVSISDVFSSRVIKELFYRFRPCHDPAIFDKVRLLTSYCSSTSSFTSSHAVNHFAAAMFIFTTFKKTISRYWGFLFVWAFIVAYAQVYVGVHFPLDVFCGAIVGMVIGYFVAKVYNKKIGLTTIT